MGNRKEAERKPELEVRNDVRSDTGYGHHDDHRVGHHTGFYCLTNDDGADNGYGLPDGLRDPVPASRNASKVSSMISASIKAENGIFSRDAARVISRSVGIMDG